MRCPSNFFCVLFTLFLVTLKLNLKKHTFLFNFTINYKHTCIKKKKIEFVKCLKCQTYTSGPRRGGGGSEVDSSRVFTAVVETIIRMEHFPVRCVMWRCNNAPPPPYAFLIIKRPNVLDTRKSLRCLAKDIIYARMRVRGGRNAAGTESMYTKNNRIVFSVYSAYTCNVYTRLRPVWTHIMLFFTIDIEEIRVGTC